MTATIPNVSRLLEKNHVESLLFTAGKFKVCAHRCNGVLGMHTYIHTCIHTCIHALQRTVTMFNEVTPESKEKFQSEIECIHGPPGLRAVASSMCAHTSHQANRDPLANAAFHRCFQATRGRPARAHLGHRASNNNVVTFWPQSRHSQRTHSHSPWPRVLVPGAFCERCMCTPPRWPRARRGWRSSARSTGS